MSEQKRNDQRITNDDLPSPPEVVEEAIENQTSISDVADWHTHKEKVKNRLVVRVYQSSPRNC